MTKRQKDEKKNGLQDEKEEENRRKNRKTKRQKKRQRQRESLILGCHGSFTLLRSFSVQITRNIISS